LSRGPLVDLTSPPKTTTDLTHCNRRTYCAMHDWLQVHGGVLSTCHVVGVLAGPQQHGSAPGSQASGAESGGAGGNILMEDEDAADAATQRLLRGARRKQWQARDSCGAGMSIEYVMLCGAYASLWWISRCRRRWCLAHDRCVMDRKERRSGTQRSIFVKWLSVRRVRNPHWVWQGLQASGCTTQQLAEQAAGQAGSAGSQVSA
jgi:hypothetical protein